LKLKRKGRRRLVTIVILLLTIAALFYAAFYSELTVRRYTYETDKLSEPLRAVLISDLHNGFYGENQSDLIAIIDRQNPDIILMAGDVADDIMPDDGIIALLEGIAHKYQCFYVSGNHEIRGNDFRELKDMLRGYGVSVLEGNTERVVINGQRVNISGVDDPVIGRARYNAQLEQVFEELDSRVFTIFLAHRPERINEYPNDCLIVTGHAHGGQWRVPFILNGLYAPNQGRFPQYAGGLYKADIRTMVVSRGLAKEDVGRAAGIPRIFNPPEIVVIDIVPRR